jgi:hypothetical protein
MPNGQADFDSAEVAAQQCDDTLPIKLAHSAQRRSREYSVFDVRLRRMLESAILPDCPEHRQIALGSGALFYAREKREAFVLRQRLKLPAHHQG